MTIAVPSTVRYKKVRISSSDSFILRGPEFQKSVSGGSVERELFQLELYIP